MMSNHLFTTDPLLLLCSDSWFFQDNDMTDKKKKYQIKCCYLTTTPPEYQSDVRSRLGFRSQDGDAQQEEAGPLLIPQVTRLYEDYHVRGEDVSNMTNIPSTRLNTG